MIDPLKIKISGEWSGHRRTIRYCGVEIGYLRRATGNQFEAVSIIKVRGRECEGRAMCGHEASELIAAYEMIKNLRDRGGIDDKGKILETICPEER